MTIRRRALSYTIVPGLGGQPSAGTGSGVVLCSWRAIVSEPASGTGIIGALSGAASGTTSGTAAPSSATGMRGPPSGFGTHLLSSHDQPAAHGQRRSDVIGLVETQPTSRPA